MLEKILHFTRLFDVYGELLTGKQKEVIKLYYYDNFSLSEIAEEFQISRQGVHDFLRRSEKMLDEYEQKLCFVAREDRIQDHVQKLLDLMEKIQLTIGLDANNEVQAKLSEAKKIISSILEE